MATKPELVRGVELLISESRRIADRFSDDEWALAAEEAGWTNKQVLAHIAGLGSIVIPMLNGMASAPTGIDLGAGIDVDAVNGQLVSARAARTVPELVQEVETSYQGLIDFIQGAPAELLDHRATVGGYRDMTVSDVAMQMVVLHGLAHVYHAASRFG